MKRLFRAVRVISTFSVVILLAACFDSGGGINNAAINAVVDKALSGFNVKHEPTIRSTMTSDVVLVERAGPDTYTTTGVDNVVSALLALRSTIQTVHQIAIHDRSVSGSGNQAVLSGDLFLDATYYTFTGGKRETTVEEWRIELSRRSGNWLIQRIERTL